MPTCCLYLHLHLHLHFHSLSLSLVHKNFKKQASFKKAWQKLYTWGDELINRAIMKSCLKFEPKKHMHEGICQGDKDFIRRQGF
ncbi:hypothetical protein I3760_14G089600 [Carya illinoinensis]|nr:hypothetical protein I3760_14G089600 [Carya illinoinensis]KAG2670519.1 hypothetical protein I3760_14G089600 [Carya illinoinensis]